MKNGYQIEKDNSLLVRLLLEYSIG